MKLIILNNVITRMIKVLESVGRVINQNPTVKEAKNIKTSPTLQKPFWKKINASIPKALKQKPSKEVYNYKGSAYKGKGNINTDTATFNHPRKDVSQGRRH